MARRRLDEARQAHPKAQRPFTRSKALRLRFQLRSCETAPASTEAGCLRHAQAATTMSAMPCARFVRDYGCGHAHTCSYDQGRVREAPCGEASRGLPFGLFGADPDVSEATRLLVEAKVQQAPFMWRVGPCYGIIEGPVGCHALDRRVHFAVACA